MPTITAAFLKRLEARRDEVVREAEGWTQTMGEGKLTPAQEVRYREYVTEIKGLAERIRETRSELERAGKFKLGSQSRGVSSAGQLAPLHLSDEQLRRAHSRISGGESVVLETRDFISAVDHLPSQLYSPPTFPRHDARVLDHLAGIQIEAPSLEYIQVNTVTGAAGIVGEGEVKPEIVMPATKLICPALKLAAHAGISWENISDYDAFVQAVRNELIARVIDLENAQLVYGNPASGGLNGLLTTPGILTYAATGTTSNFDDIAGAIAKLRTGPALAVPDLLLLHPDTWAALRTQKDDMGRYYVAADPSQEQVEQIWGVPVLQSTQFIPGQGVLLDTQLVGRVAVREPMVLRVGFSGDDFVRNIVRSIAEERLNLAVERPAAICLITALPTAEVAEDEGETKTTKRATAAKK